MVFYKNCKHTVQLNILFDELINGKKIERNIHQGYYRHTCIHVGMIDEPCHDTVSAKN